ncbi:MAG TPA: hypothetical protein VJM32_04855 [Candidatus Saccharimonadales bacterium]|nr:hypothetical protein [Candidatus Saccharimonadales bacterium]
MSKKLLLLDLDRTLLDTKRFMNELWTEISRQYNLDYDHEMSRVPHWYRSMDDYRYYDLRLHIQEGLALDPDVAVAAVTPALKKIDFLFPDVSELAEWRKHTDYELRIMTFGPRWVQEFKLAFMPELADIAADIILEPKGQFIARQYAGRQGMLVDDKRNADLPHGFREIWLDRDGTNQRPEGIITINSLTELREVL